MSCSPSRPARSVLSRAEGAGIDLDADAAKRAVERLKEREHARHQYEAADASFELLLRRNRPYDPCPGPRASGITEKRADEGRDGGDHNTGWTAAPRATAEGKGRGTRSTGRCAM